jgi:hypothetical protein
MYAGGEHHLRRHIGPLIDQLVSALALAYPVAPDFALSLTLRFLTGDHLALGVLLCVRLGTRCCIRFLHYVLYNPAAALTRGYFNHMLSSHHARAQATPSIAAFGRGPTCMPRAGCATLGNRFSYFLTSSS